MTKEEEKQYKKLYYEKNKEKLLLQSKEYREKNKDKRKEYLENNKDKIKQQVNQYNKIYNQINKEKISLNQKEYYKNNKEVIIKNVKEYYENNKEVILNNVKEYSKNNREKIYQYRNKKIQSNPLFKLNCNIRRLIGNSIKNKGYKKLTKSELILGYSVKEFKLYLESQFQSWMSWDNYGKYNGELNYGWDIDHIVPVSSATTEEDILRLNHYTNLQPLCSKINRYIKKDKLYFIK
jgi:hypothetical protein